MKAAIFELFRTSQQGFAEWGGFVERAAIDGGRELMQARVERIDEDESLPREDAGH